MMKQNTLEDYRPKRQSAAVSNKLIQQAGIAGFSFFLIKGLAWIAITIWAIH